MFFGRKRSIETELRNELATLYRVARRMCRDGTDAEDLVAQTLLKACRAYDQFDGQHVRSWLIKIMRNEHANRLRSESTRVQALELTDEIAPCEPPFWDEVTWRMGSDAILDELQSLPEEYGLAVHLCDVEQLSYEEAAEAMEVPIGTVRSRLFRGRAQLRSRLATRFEEEPIV